MEKKYDYQHAEKDAQALWDAEKIYAYTNQEGPLYSIDTPPPTVSGALHIGHIFSYTQTDIIARYKRMNGHAVFYPFGFDDNGLPTERFVEKKREITAHQVGRTAFIEACLQETHSVEEQFKQLWQRMGLSVDWSACYSTIDRQSRAISQKSFIELYKKGFAYRKEEPALYCTACRTSVAQAELDDVEKQTLFNDLVFTTTDNEELIIATTRPELLGSCVAVLYHPEDTRYQHLAGKSVIVPLFNNTVPLIADESVVIEKGSGLVMCCTFGDKTDIEWYKKHKFSYKPSFGQDGRFIQGPLAGLKVAAAREAILALLKDAGVIRQQKTITHAVNIHERCKNPIEYLMIAQWFIKILPHKEQLLALADSITWYPSFMKTRYKNWVENLQWDWGISRQRFYGIPFPVWYCKDCSTVIVPDEKILPVDPQEMQPYTTCSQCASHNLIPDTDVMDTWNTSSLTPYICAQLYGKENFMPMSMRPQAHDIIRTWAFYTIVKAWMHDNIIPWKTIVISGHVLSSEKEKISKSQGNSPLIPENLLKTYPADVIRYWTASATLGQDVAFSESQFKIGQRLLTKMWNAFIFIKEHTVTSANFDGKMVHDWAFLSDADSVHQWLAHRISETHKLYVKYFEEHEFSLALDTIERFFWHDVCDNYLELVKDQLLHPENYSAQQVATTRTMLYTTGIRILQLYAAYIPHITEAIYNAVYGNGMIIKSLHQTKFSHYDYVYENQESAHAITLVLQIVSEVRRLKSDHQLSLKTELSQLVIHSTHNLTSQERLIAGISRAHIIVFSAEPGVSQLIAYNNDTWKATVTV
ncbi:MAG: valine--tRNA ligase [Candidatus Babeliaceae bacterium]|jgi:valyl-tRNA synthetase